MLKNYILVKDGIVDNVILLDDANIADYLDSIDISYTLIEQTDDNKQVNIDDLYDVETDETTPKTKPEIPRVRVITKLEFREKFTFEELIEIDNFSSSETLNPQDIRIIRTIVKNFDSAKEVNLDSPLVSQGLTYLESFGLIASGRTLEIIG